MRKKHKEKSRKVSKRLTPRVKMDLVHKGVEIGPLPEYRFFSTLDLGLSYYDSQLENNFKKDLRFLSIKVKGTATHFILKRTLLDWFLNLSVILAEADRVSLDVKWFLTLLNSRRVKGKWEEIPEEVLEFGSKYGLIKQSYFGNVLVFPLAVILRDQYYAIKTASRYAKELITELIGAPETDNIIILSLDHALRELLSGFHDRDIYVVLSREGIFTGKKRTLGEIGKDLEVTRERVRQIEKGFWRKAHHHIRMKRVFKGFLANFIRRGGQLIYKDNGKVGSSLKFILKYLEIPHLDLSEKKLIFIGINSKTFDELQSSKDLENKIILRKGASEFIFEKSEVGYSKEEFKTFKDIIIVKKQQTLTKAKRAYMVLKKIGRPAHYSIVAREYQKRYPDENMSEHNIHAILGRRDLDMFVWIGIMGTYALKEWGYKKPDKPLFETVEEIVKNVYRRTSKPVPITTIKAELGKYRRIVNPSSVTQVLIYSKHLKRVNDDKYIPTSKRKPEKNASLFSRWDQALRKFQSRNL